MKANVPKKYRVVYEVGVNDADYLVEVRVKGKLWVCPYYRVWVNMLLRGLPQARSRHEGINITYEGVAVCDEWLYFMNFREWMEKQDWEGKHLDKDLLGGREYRPENCVFVPRTINNFFTLRGNCRGDYPLGVHWHKASNKYSASCNSPFEKGRGYLGISNDPFKCHRMWQEKKSEVAMKLSETTDDLKVKSALYAVAKRLEEDILNNRETTKLIQEKV